MAWLGQGQTELRVPREVECDLEVCMWGAFEISCHELLVGEGEGDQSLVFQNYILGLCLHMTLGRRSEDYFFFFF